MKHAAVDSMVAPRAMDETLLTATSLLERCCCKAADARVAARVRHAAVDSMVATRAMDETLLTATPLLERCSGKAEDARVAAKHKNIGIQYCRGLV